MTHEQLIGKIENILFAAGDSMAISELARILGIPEAELEAALEVEQERREASYGLVFRRLEDRVQLATRSEYAHLLMDLFGSKSGEELTKAMLRRFLSSRISSPSPGGD